MHLKYYVCMIPMLIWHVNTLNINYSKAIYTLGIIRIKMDKRIEQYIANFKNEQHNSIMPTISTKPCVDNKFQPQYDWNGT